jgi:hypothetical protein
MNGFAGSDLAGTAATWVAAAATIAVWSYLVGARAIFRSMQYLLAGLATGYVALLAIDEVLVPRLVTPLVTEPAANLLLVPAAALVAVMIGAAWLPPRVTAPVIAVLVAGIAAFALGGAVLGTLLPQVAASVLPRVPDEATMLDAILALGITVLVLLAFLHGSTPGRISGRAAVIGRWLLVGGIGGWLGFLMVSRLALLVDRLGFLLGDWLGVLR